MLAQALVHWVIVHDAEQLVETLVSRLKAAREAKGLSLRDLEEISGISNAGIHHIEAGNRSPTLYSLIRIANALDLDIGGVIAEAESEQSK